MVAAAPAAAGIRAGPLLSGGYWNLPEETAKRLVIEGFLAALVERFPDGPVRETLTETLDRRLQLILTR